MWLLIYILLSPEGLQDIKPVRIYYDQRKCVEKVDQVAKSEPNNHIWLACVHVENVRETHSEAK